MGRSMSGWQEVLKYEHSKMWRFYSNIRISFNTCNVMVHTKQYYCIQRSLWSPHGQADFCGIPSFALKCAHDKSWPNTFVTVLFHRIHQIMLGWSIYANINPLRTNTGYVEAKWNPLDLFHLRWVNVPLSPDLLPPIVWGSLQFFWSGKFWSLE